MTAETPLRNVSLHDPVENETKSFPGERVGNEFHFRPIQTDAWIIETRARWQITRPDHDDLARSRAF
jgi:hypothetical protein